MGSSVVLYDICIVIMVRSLIFWVNYHLYFGWLLTYWLYPIRLEFFQSNSTVFLHITIIRKNESVYNLIPSPHP